MGPLGCTGGAFNAVVTGTLRVRIPSRNPAFMRNGERATSPWYELTEVDVATIRFRGSRDFQWHSNLLPAHNREARDFPTITTMHGEGDTYASVDSEIQRLLAALAFVYEIGLTSGGVGGVPRLPEAPSRVRAGPGFVTRVATVPDEVVVVDDAVLRLVLAHHREGMNTESPFFRFLAYWNALDVAFDGDEGARDAGRYVWKSAAVG
jgi:hypothetical protein